MPIDHDHAFVFVHIPKTAGTSILCSLFGVSVDRYEFVDSSKLSKEYQTRCLIGDDGAFRRLHHYPLSKIVQLQDDLDRFYKFAFIRNPFDRMVSEYFFLRFNRAMPFDDFLENIVKMTFEQGKLTTWFSFHLLPQLEFVSLNGKVACDFLGRFESLHRDYRKLCDAIGIERKPLPEYKKSTRRHYREYYSSQSRAIVESLYKKDLDAFNYDF